MLLAAVEPLDPNGVQELIDTTYVTAWDFLWAGLTLVAGFLLARVARTAARSALSKVDNLPENLAGLATKVAGWAVITTAIVLALPFVGVDTGPVFIIVLVVAALVVLSGRVLLENLGAGVILQTEATFQPGDQIETSESVGRVIEVSSRAVKIETIDGRLVVIPNVSVLRGPVVNLTARSTRRGELVVGLEYGTELGAARAILTRAAQDTAGVSPEPPVNVFVSKFGDSSIEFLVWYWHGSDILTQYRVTDAVARNIDRACRDNGLTIAFPQRTLWWGEQPPQHE
jgi:small-conductance mechanosensitive channel